MSGFDLMSKPKACVIDGDKICIFIGSGYRTLPRDEAALLRDEIDAALRVPVLEVVHAGG